MHQEDSTEKLDKSHSVISGMFDRIAHRYDFLNRVTSFGTDVRWRKKLIDLLPNKTDMRLLDLATGTGDVLLTLLNSSEGSRFSHAIGMDISTKMLDIGRDKVAMQDLSQKVDMIEGDATQITLDSDSVDVVAMAFGIRNVTNVSQALSEIYRVLSKNGRALILEFSLPENELIKRGYLTYFRHVLPRIGSLVSGDSHAYRYLNQSVESFPYGAAFSTLMKQAGFRKVSMKALSFGIATIYIGDK